VPFSPSGTYTADAVGVTPGGAIVADVMGALGRRHWAYAYLHGHRYQLKTPRSWSTVTLLTVTNSGQIIGYGLTGPRNRPTYHLVSWATIHASPKALMSLPPRTRSVVADQDGDIAWSYASPWWRYIQRVRLPSGVIRTLAPGDGDTSDFALASGSRVFAQDGGGVEAWDIHRAATTAGPIPGRKLTAGKAYLDDPDAAGPDGAVVWGGDHRSVLYPSNRGYRIPGEYYADGPVGETITSDGRVAFTAAKDHLIHILTCPRH
jgi:hypothetical protein